MKRLLIFMIIVAFSLGSLALPSPAASALSGADFRAGRIIDDAIFFNSVAIDTSGVQAFLNSKVPVCDTNGTQAYGGTTRAAYGASKGYPPPFTCLKDYRQDTPARAAEPGLCNGFPGGNKSAAQIIQEVGLSCGVNQRVLIVLLEKEQSLVTDDWPWSSQYRSATGYGCPDTAPCDAEYYGFFNQVYSAARQFRRYQKDETVFSYRKFRDNYIQYNPVASCGGTNVFIQNQATAGLYNYTPYQPNASALNNLDGSGDSCGAYGNRNFWRIYNNWFGSTMAEPAHPDGTFIRNDSDGGIYYMEGNQRRHVTSMAILNSYLPLRGYWLKRATLADMLLGDGPAISYPEGVVLRTPDGGIYVTDYGTTGLTKRLITSMTAFTGLGYSYQDIVPVTPGDLPATNGANITSADLHPDGSLVRNASTGGVYYLEAGQKRHIPSMGIFNSLRGTNRLRPMTSQDIALPDGITPVNYTEGVVLKGSGPNIYVTDYNQNGLNRRIIASQYAFDVLGYNYADIVFVNDNELPTQTGLSIQ